MCWTFMTPEILCATITEQWVCACNSGETAGNTVAPAFLWGHNRGAPWQDVAARKPWWSAKWARRQVKCRKVDMLRCACRQPFISRREAHLINPFITGTDKWHHRTCYWCLHNKFHTPTTSTSLVTSIKLKAKNRFQLPQNLYYSKKAIYFSKV
jgi:hypothetical protein